MVGPGPGVLQDPGSGAKAGAGATVEDTQVPRYISSNSSPFIQQVEYNSQRFQVFTSRLGRIPCMGAVAPCDN